MKKQLKIFLNLSIFHNRKKVNDVQIIYNARGSKGFGFVTIVGEESAQRVKNALHGSIIQGHYLI